MPKSFKKKNDDNGPGPMKIYGDSTTYNMNPLLRDNILLSQFFKELLNLKFCDEILTQINIKVKHVEPWNHATSGIPSTMFCCLFRLMTLRLSKGRIVSLMENQQNAYIRCAGFLIIRYCSHPNLLWQTLNKYLYEKKSKFPFFLNISLKNLTKF